MQHWDFINYLVEQYGYQKYLEIGVSGGECLNQIKCRVVHGVDPNPNAKGQFKITSDEFFEMLEPNYTYDIVFIDGLHTEEQVDKDVQNALKILNPNGTIILHDCNPPTEWHQRSYEEFIQQPGQWNGTCWRSIVKLRQRSDLQVETIDADWGCAIVRRGQQDPIKIVSPFTYQDLERDRQYMLGLISVEQFLEKYNIKKYYGLSRATFNQDFSNTLEQESEKRLGEFTDMLLYNENFTMVKFHDGEILNMLTNNESETNCDGSNYYRVLGDDLIKAYIYFLHKKDAYINSWPISFEILEKMQSDFKDVFDNSKFLYSNMLVQKLPLKQQQITFFKAIKNSNRHKLYISNKEMIQALCPLLNISNAIIIPEINCFLQKERIVQLVLNQVQPNMIVLVSAGMCAKVLIAELSKLKPNVIYLDIGSTFDGLVKQSRDYNSVPGYKEALLETYR